MPIPLGRLVLSSIVSLVLCAPLTAQIPARWASCRMDSLATWNCAQYYSGTVSLTSELRGTNIHQAFRVIATVTGGQVRCRVNGTEVGEFEGPGMLAVEPASTENAGEYRINVWCPEAADRPVRRRDSPLIVITEQRATDYARLQGTDAHEHPDTDAANGVSGTETIAWELRRP